MNTLTKLVVLAGLSAIVSSGCATQPGTSDGSRLVYQTVDEGAHPLFQEVVENPASAEQSGFRTSVNPADQQLADFRLHLDFAVRPRNLVETEVIWAQTTLLLFTLYPATCGRYELELTGDLFDRDGSRVKTWHMVEQDTAFMWMFHGKDCGDAQSDDTVRKIASNMLEQLYVRMSSDGVLGDHHLTPIADQPLVYLSASDAHAVIERVVRTDEPYANFTFDPQIGKDADLTINILFQFISPDQGFGGLFGRFTGAMFTMGLVSLCPPNEMVLLADVTDSDGNSLKSYRLSKKKRGSLIDNCAAPTDETHPEMIAKLLRALFKQIGKDGLIS